MGRRLKNMLAVLVAAALFAVFSGGGARAEIVVFAAASLTDVAQALGDRFSAESGEEVVFVFGSSSAMARQVVAGAPADIFLSANKGWIDQVHEKVSFGVPSVLFNNRLVIVAPKGTSVTTTLAELPEMLGDRRLAVGDPDHVPAGIYAKAALQSAGVWQVLEPKLAPAENVRAALRLVERGAAPFGIIYATDASGPGVEIAGEIDQALYPPVTYYVALVDSAPEAAENFVAFILSPAGEEIITGFGFVPRTGNSE